MTKEQIIERAKTMGFNNLFAHHEGFKELQDYIERFNKSEKALAYIIMGLTVNTLSYEIAKQSLEGSDEGK